MVIRTSLRLQKPFRNVPFGMRPTLLEGDTGTPPAGGGGNPPATSPTTPPTAPPTTLLPTTPPTSGAPGQPNAEAKFTQADIDAALAKAQADNEAAVAEAERKAKEDADIENGKAKEIAQNRLQEIQDLKAKIARMEAPLTTNIEAETKDWPASVLAKKPGKEGGYDALLTWYETYKDVAADIATKLSQSSSQTHGNGGQPLPDQNGANNQPAVVGILQSKYAPKKAG